MSSSRSRRALRTTGLGAAALAVAAAALTAPPSSAQPTALPATSTVAQQTVRIVPNRYIVTLAGHETHDGSFAADAGSTTVRKLVRAAGGGVVADYRQIGVVIASSETPTFAEVLGASPLVQSVGHDFGVKVYESQAPERSTDPMESLQWHMALIRTQQAHSVQAGRRAVDVGVLDSGIDGRHHDFFEGGELRVDCARGHDSLATLPPGTAVGQPDPCSDNQFHGTHVAGTIGARVNGLGTVGVAPNVTLVPVKTCDSSGYCYVTPVVDAITYSGKIKLDVINMSFFVDNDDLQESTEFKCESNPTQLAFRQAVYRAVQYARGRGVTPIAAMGNSDQDLNNPVDENGEPLTNRCKVVPAETSGVISASALGPDSEKSRYSNYGAPRSDIAAPGGNGTTGDCNGTVLSTLPAQTYGCIQGTSMASPHAAGVAALIVSEFGRLGADGDMKISPDRVERILEATAVDIGKRGYDECFGHGRIDAKRAVLNRTTHAYDEKAPFCPEYKE